jgi:diguanylate cyclase (GGDEF)-like protein/PAS domain S-box-containing protein
MASTPDWSRASGGADAEDSAPSPTDDIDDADARAGAQLALQAAITEHMGCGVALVRVDDAVIVYANSAFARMLGYALGELEGQPISVVNAPTDRAPEEIAKDIIGAVHRNGVWSGRIENLKKDGSSCWCRASVTPLEHPDHGPVWVAVHSDVTDVKRNEDALHRAREQFEQAFERAPIGMALVNLDGQLMRVNEALCVITGYNARELVTKTFQELTHPDDLDADLELARQLLAGQIQEYQIEKRYVDANGRHVWINLSGTLVRDGHGEPRHFIAQVQDIAERKRLEDRLRDLADHDSLTGLRNRRVFEEALLIQVGRCQRYGEQAALVMIDLDDFKAVNDTHGHRAGDRLLKAVAAAITGRIRATDTAARLGGDEFAVLLTHFDNRNASAFADQLQQAIAAACIHDGGHELRVRASVGLELINEHTATDELVLAAADRAMYRAKQDSADRLQPPQPDSQRQFVLVDERGYAQPGPPTPRSSQALQAVSALQPRLTEAMDT